RQRAAKLPADQYVVGRRIPPVIEWPNLQVVRRPHRRHRLVPRDERRRLRAHWRPGSFVRITLPYRHVRQRIPGWTVHGAWLQVRPEQTHQHETLWPGDDWPDRPGRIGLAVAARPGRHRAAWPR